MSRQLSWSSLILWIFSILIFSSVRSLEVKNREPPARNGWQPLTTYDNAGNVSPPSNYAAYPVSHFDSERESSFKPSKQHRKSVDTIHQYDYTPPSILGSFSIFGHSIPKNRDGDESKSHRDSNTNEYDFLVPPPRQKIDPYQKIKVNGDAYGGPSHYRDIYTSLNTQFTFIPTGVASSVVKKLPGALPSRDELGHHHPLRQYPTADGDTRKPMHPKHSSWMQNIRDNIDPYHVNVFRQYPVHPETIAEGGNRFYTQIGHPPVFKSTYEIKNPLKPVIENPNDYVTHHPGNPYVVQSSSSQRNEFTSFITANTRHAEPQHYGFNHNSVGKQKLEASSGHLQTGPDIDNYYNGRKKNSTNWSIPTSKNQFSELLPKLNKPMEFNRPSNAVPQKTYIPENRLKSQMAPEKILPSVPKTRQETPESISLKHFNEQQFLLQQQLLERDRQKLEHVQTHQKPTNKPKEKYKERESTRVEPTFDDELQFYEAVKLPNEEKLSPERRPSTIRITENYATKQVYELPTKESFTIDHSSEQVTHKPMQAHNPFSGKKKKGNHQRIIVESEMNTYDRKAVYNRKNHTLPDNIPNTHIELGITTTSSQFIPETKPSVSTVSDMIPRTSQTSTTQTQAPVTSPSEPGRTIPLITDTTTRKSTTTKTRSQSRGPTRRRRPVLEPEATSFSTSIQPTSSSIKNTSEDFNYPRLRATPSYHSTETSSTNADDFQEYRNENKHSTPEQEDKGNTVVSEDLVILVTHGHKETTEGRPSSSKLPTVQYDHIDTTPSSTHHIIIDIPEETTAKTPERIRTTARDYSYSIAPLEHLFNFTETNGGDETSTQASESEISNSPVTVEKTTRPTYRLRPMKIANNTRPRFSVKDYKSRLDYRNRMSQTSTTESNSMVTVSMKSKGTGKYKYTPRNSYTKTKSSTQSSNVTDTIEGKRNKIPGHRPFTAGIHRNRGVDNTTEASNSETIVQVNAPVKENKFIQPIRRRPQLKTSAQFAQMIKKSKNHLQPLDRTTQQIQIKSEFPTEESSGMSTSTKSGRIRIKSKDTLDIDIDMDSPGKEKEQHKNIEELTESTTAEIVKNSFQDTHSSIQSDEEAFARASLSVADLTSSASALYNKPGMFKALSTVPVFESDIHKKALTPSMDEPSLPIEAFFRELSNKEK